EPLPRGEKAAGEPAEHRTDRKSRELDVGRVDAERAAGELVLAQGFPGAPDRQFADAQSKEVGDERHRQDHEIKKGHAVLWRKLQRKELVKGCGPFRRRAGERQAEKRWARD